MFLTTEISGTSALNQSPIEKKEQLGKALGRLASGVFIVTCQSKGNPQGMLATWIAQAAFEPPMVTISINKQRDLAKVVATEVELTINVLSNQNMDIFKAFAKPSSGQEQDRFTGLDVIVNPTGGPIFAKCVAYLNCRVANVIEAGDHFVALAEVLEGATLNDDAEPMTHFRKSGFQY